MNLGTAGAILSYALELEAKTNKFYENILSRDLNSSVRETFEAIRKHHRKITKKLDRMRKENVTEMILEPIHNHDRDDYSIRVHGSTDIIDIMTTSKHIEETLEEFLLASAEKASFLPEMSQMLKDLAKKIGRNLELLSNSV